MIVIKRKGIIKAIEGVMAAALLLGYASSFLDFPEINSAWEEHIINQESSEYLSAIADTNIKNAIVDNQGEAFVGITRHFLGFGKGYSFETKNLVAPIVHVGVLVNPSDRSYYEADNIASPCPSEILPVETGSPCYTEIATLDGSRSIVVADKVIDGERNYDAAYVYIGNSYKGPFRSGELFNTSPTAYFQIGVIGPFELPSPNRVNVSFYSANEVNDIKKGLDSIDSGSGYDLKINGRKTNFSVKGVLAHGNDSKAMDVLVIGPNYQLSSNKGHVIERLFEGAGIVGLHDPNNLNYDWMDIFDLRDMGQYGTLGTGIKSRTFALDGWNPFFEANSHFSLSGIELKTPNTVDANTRSGELVLENTYDITINDSEPDGTFDAMYIDLDLDGEFESSEKKTVNQKYDNLEDNEYTVKKIDAKGEFAVLGIGLQHTFSGFADTTKKIYALSNNSGDVLIRHLSAKFCYNATSNNACNDFPSVGSEQTTNQGAIFTYMDHQITEINSANGYIEITGPEVTGKVYNKSTARLGPDTFRITILGGNSLKWALSDRWAVPGTIGRYDKSTGTTILIKKPSKDDEWAYFKSLVAIASSRKHDLSRDTFGRSRSVSSSQTIVLDEDFVQPFTARLTTWY